MYLVQKSAVINMRCYQQHSSHNLKTAAVRIECCLLGEDEVSSGQRKALH